MVSSITIGDGADFATISLWQQSRRSNIVNNVVNDELTLLGGTYDATVLLWYWPTDTEELSINVTMQAHPSALHNGDWDSGVCLSGGTQNWKVKYNDLNVTYRDIVFKKAQVNIEQGTNYFGSMRGTGWDMSSVHHGSLTFDRCMIYTEGQPHTRIYYESYTPSSSPSAFGTFEANYNNCVLEDTIGPVYPDKGQIMPSPYRSLGHHTYNFRGCTLSKQGFLSSHRITNYAPSASLTVNLSGCIEDTSSAAQPTLIPGHAINLGYYPGGAGFPSSLSATIVDHITNEASGSVYDWAQTKTNVSYEVPFNFDGTVTSGEVNFVDNAGASSFRDYRLVADLDNLPVRYIDTSKPSFLGRRDVAREPRPGLMDVGAYQSITNTVSSFEIGSSAAGHYKDGAYATVALWYATERTSIQNGDIINLEFLSGAPHSVGANCTAFNEVNFDLNLKPASSVSHNGNWDEGVAVDFSTYHFWVEAGDQSISLKFEDLIVSSSPSPNYKTFFRNPNATSGSCGAYSYDFTYSKCLLAYHRDSLQASFGAETRDSLGNLTEVGNYTFTLENCVSDSPEDYFTYFGPVQDMECNVTFNFIGSTMMRREGINQQGYGITRIYTNSTSGVNSTLTHTFKGFISDFTCTHFNSLNQNLQKKVYNFTDSVFLSYNLSATTLNYASGTYNFSNYTDIRPVANYDGTVTSGEINFVDNGSVSALRDFRLVPDLDNLPVKYMTSGELSYKDITGYKRPGGTDQRDAGAYQSISDKVTVRSIGTSSADFTPDYATISLWDSGYYDNANVLNGETHVLRFKSGEDHGNTIVVIDIDDQANVNQSFVISGHQPHYGVWESGAIIKDQSVFDIRHTDPNNFEIKFKDIVLSGTTVDSTIGMNPLIIRRISNSKELGSAATEQTFEFENCLIKYVSERSYGANNSPRLVYGTNNSYLNDSDGNIIERGGSDYIFRNCNIIHPNPTSGYLGGFVILGGEFASTNSSATLLLEGCTLINSVFMNSRYGGDRFQASTIGCLIYSEPSGPSLSNYDTGLSLLNAGHGDPSDHIIIDSIFNRGAGNAYAPKGYQDRYTFWIAEPISSEYADSTSASVVTNANNYYWPRVNATNMSIRVPFNFDGTVSAGTVSLIDGSSGVSNYRLVADPDNLAVQYINTSKDSFIGRRDIAGEPRPAEGDVGAFQSISTNVSSFSIGTSAEFNTFTLMHNTIKNDILNGDTVEAEFLSGTHSIAGFITPKEVNHSYVLKAHASAYHNGDWNSGVNFSGGSIIAQPEDNSFSLTLKDIVVRNYEAGVAVRSYGTTNKSGAYKYSTILDSCLIETGNRFVFNNAFTGGQTLDDSGNVVEVHDRLLEFRNCAIHGLPSCQYVGVWGSISPQGCAHMEANCIGTTFAKLDDSVLMIGFFDIGYGGNAEDGSLTYNISGSLIGGRFTQSSNISQGNGLNAPKVFNFADSVFDDFPMDIPGLIINKTINETNVTKFRAYIGSQVPFNFDGTVTSGQVNFVDNGSASSLPDLRLVADLDNLPVKYMTQDSLTYKDITGYKRPGGIDQRDAGAYQSISDKNTVYKIGTSSVDFPADYATSLLWSFNDHFYANVLNGETHTLQFKSGEIHSPYAFINFNGTVGSVSANVNQSFVYSGQTPHNGNWDEGAILAINGSTNGAGIGCGKNSFNFTVKDLSLVVSGNAVNRRLLNVSPTHNRNYTIPGYLAPEFTYTFENFMARMDDGLSSISYLLTMDQNYERITDEDLNILERGSSKSIHKNCLYIGATSSTGIYSQGAFSVYGHQYDTQASAFFQTEGCTFINSCFDNNRHSILTNLEVDHAGLIYYASESHVGYFGRQLALHSPGGFGQGQNLSHNITATNNSKFVDCIFNNGAGDSIASPASQDRYITWVIEPLPSEYTDSTSAAVESVQPWNVWASALTNCSFRVPFNFDGSVSAGTVSFVSGGESNYRLVADSDNLPVEYMDLSSLSEQKDLTGRRRPGLTNPGPYQMYDDSTFSAIIGSGVDGVSANFATVALLKSTSANDILNGQTVEAVLQDQPHNLHVELHGSNALKEVDQHWILRGDTTQDGLWDTGARTLSGVNQYIFNGAILRNAFSLELRDITINNPNYYAQPRFGQAVDGSIHDTELFINKCLINTSQDLHYAYPTLVSLIGDEYNTHTLKIFDSVITSPPNGDTSRYLDAYYFSFGTDPNYIFRGRGNSNTHIKGSTIFNKIIGGGHFTSQSSTNTVKIEGSILAKWIPDSQRVFQRNFADHTITDTLISNTSSFEYTLPGTLTNVSFDTDFYFDNKDRDGAVTFIGSALGGISVYNNGDLDFRLGGDPRVRTNLAVGYIPSQEDFGEAGDAGAFAYNAGLLKAIILDAIPKYTIGYRININR